MKHKFKRFITKQNDKNEDVVSLVDDEKDYPDVNIKPGDRVSLTGTVVQREGDYGKGDFVLLELDPVDNVPGHDKDLGHEPMRQRLRIHGAFAKPVR